MKTRKVLALVVLAAMVLSLMPAMAFGNLGTFSVSVPRSSVMTPPSAVPAQTRFYHSDDGNEFTVTLVGGAGENEIFVASSRPTVVAYFWWDYDDPSWKPFYSNGDVGYFATTITGALDISEAFFQRGAANVLEATIKVIAQTSGTAQIVFGTCEDCVADYAAGRAIGTSSSTDGDLDHTVSNVIIEGRRLPAEFTAAKAGWITLDLAPFEIDGEKPANSVDSYTLWAFVYTGRTGAPVSNQQVNFTIYNGPGASLSSATASTNAAGRAEIRVYSSRPGEVEVVANVSGLTISPSATGVTNPTWADDIDFRKPVPNTDPQRYEAPNREWVHFKSTGIVSIKAESPDTVAKVGRDTAGRYRRWQISCYDANGNWMDMYTIGLPAGNFNELGQSKLDTTKGNVNPRGIIDLTASVTAKPSGAALLDKDIEFSIREDGNLDLSIDYEKLNKDGDYEFKVYLINGTAVSYRFNVRDLGDIIEMRVTYPFGNTTYAAGTVLPEPTIEYRDADGYALSRSFSTANQIGGGDVVLSISDATFMDSQLHTNGQFKLKNEKVGTLTITAVDRSRNMVASLPLTIELPASYLLLTPRSTGAVGSEVIVDIQLVDTNGKKSVVGLGVASARASVINPQSGVVSSTSAPFTGNFGLNGSSYIRVSSNGEGEVLVQAIITEIQRAYPWVTKNSKDEPVPTSGLSTQSYKDWLALVPESEKYGGRTYTGPGSVIFGSTTAGGGTLIFIIGAPSYVAGSSAFAAESPAFIEGGRTFLGVRDIGTAIGATIDWDQDTQTATIAKDNVVVKVTVGAESISVTKNGVTSEAAIDAPAQNKAGRVYLPFRALLEAFGYTVTWDEGTQSIVCTIV